MSPKLQYCSYANLTIVKMLTGLEAALPSRWRNKAEQWGSAEGVTIILRLSRFLHQFPIIYYALQAQAISPDCVTSTVSTATRPQKLTPSSTYSASSANDVVRFLTLGWTSASSEARSATISGSIHPAVIGSGKTISISVLVSLMVKTLYCLKSYTWEDVFSTQLGTPDLSRLINDLRGPPCQRSASRQIGEYQFFREIIPSVLRTRIERLKGNKQ